MDPAEFADLGEYARQLGFTSVASAPMVRSSYHADLQAVGDIAPGTYRDLVEEIHIDVQDVQDIWGQSKNTQQWTSNICPDTIPAEAGIQ